MRCIDLEKYPRREHFEVFRTFENPHFNMCANLEMRDLHAFTKKHRLSLNLAIVYILSCAANSRPEFRYRIRGDEIVEHEIVHPSSTILGKNDVFSFCTMEYRETFPDFAAKNAEKIARVQERPRLLAEDQSRDDLLFMTAIPWVSFTSFMHPVKFPIDSVPRFSWGKFFEDGNAMKIPLSVQGHHALMDGLHMGLYFDAVQEYFSQPEKALNQR